MRQFFACPTCIHYEHPINPDGNGKCAAWPLGLIPMSILTGRNRHTNLLPDQVKPLKYESVDAQ